MQFLFVVGMESDFNLQAGFSELRLDPIAKF